MTKKDYETAAKAWKEYVLNPPSIHFKEWLESKINEPTKPQYRCISNSWPFECMIIGNKGSPRHFPDLSHFPFHWQLIEEEEVITRTKAELIDWAMRAYMSFDYNDMCFEDALKQTELL